MATFDAAAYLKAKAAQLDFVGFGDNKDWTADEVQQAFEANNMTALGHYVYYGKEELAQAKEQGAKIDFNVDLASAFNQQDYLKAKAEQLNTAEYQGRSDWTAQDVQQAFEANDLTALEHYALYGREELNASDIQFDPGFEVDGVDTDQGDQDDSGQSGDDIYIGDHNVVEGTAGNDTFHAQSQTDGGGLGGQTIDGGAGQDTLEAIQNGSNIFPTINNVETVNVNAQPGLNYVGENAQATINARNITGTENVTSKYSDADLLIKNMTTEGVGNTNDMHFGMYHTGNADHMWSASSMTVFFDQDYLKSSQEQSGYFFDIMDQENYDQTDGAAPVGTFPLTGIQFTVESKDGDTQTYTLKVTEKDMEGVKTTSDLVKMLNENLADADLGLEGKAQFSVGSQFTDAEGLRTSQSAILQIDGPGAVVSGEIKLDTSEGAGNLYWNQGDLGTVDVPVTTNVDLTKAGNSGDGGALTIGSMNKEGDNSIEGNHTVNGTVAGFQQFNVTVHGGYHLSSSLAALQSTNNTLETVVVDSEGGSKGDWADLWIGNSNTDDVGTEGLEWGTVAQNAQALKDVATFNASALNGDLHLHAALTDEFGSKYDAFSDNGTTDWTSADGSQTLNQLGNRADDNVQVAYDGGSGNDTIDIAISEEVATASNLVDGGVSLSVNGNAGNDTIDVSGGATAKADNTGDWTINGGAGNDTITLSQGQNTVVFSQKAGNDVVTNFDVTAPAPKAEEQTLDLSDVTLDKGDSLTVKIDGESVVYTATSNNETGNGLLGNVVDAINADDSVEGSYSASGSTVTQGGTPHNIGSIAVSVGGDVVATGVTTVNGQSASETVDVLDFSSYNLDALFVDGANMKGNLKNAGDTYINLVDAAAGEKGDGLYEIQMDHANKSAGNIGNDGGVTVVGTIDLTDSTGKAVDLGSADAAQFAIAG